MWRERCHTIYGYGRTIYDHKPYKKLAFPVQLQVFLLIGSHGRGHQGCVTVPVLLRQ